MVDPRRATIAFWSVVGAAAAACVGLLAPYLGDRLMHRDEALTLMLARRPTLEMLETVQLVRGGAPLHFLLARAVAELGGGLSATRAISALFAVLAVIAVALLGRALAGPLEGAIAAWLAALSPVALYYGQFARMYSMFLALSTLALWCLVRALDDDEPRWWAGLAALLVLDVYTHPYGVVVGVICAATVLVTLLVRRGRARWRRPLLAAGAVVVGTLPLGIGYAVLASRLGDLPQPAGAAVTKPSLPQVFGQVFAHVLGVPRTADPTRPAGLYLLACAGLALAGIVLLARRGPARATLLAAWLVLPLATLAVVRIPNSDNHVRYVIYLVPLIAIAVATGAVGVGRLLGPRGALAAAALALVALPAVALLRGERLPDYRYRGAETAAQRRAVSDATAYLRRTFAPNDLFFGYDEAWGYAVVHPAGNAALGAARGVARSEAPLIVRSLGRLHGPIAHGWYVVEVRDTARCKVLAAHLAPAFSTHCAGPWAIVRTTAQGLDRQAFARAGLTVFSTAGAVLPASRPQAYQFTEAALRSALPDVSP